MEQYWYYQKEGKQVGPIKESELIDLIFMDSIKPETLVRSESMSTWKMAGTLDEFRSKFKISAISFFNQKTEQERVTQTDGPEKEKKPDGIETEGNPSLYPSPWHRLFAREFVDYILFMIALVAAVGIAMELQLISAQNTEILTNILGFSLPFLWIFVEALLLSTWGTTPGKWMMNITVRTDSGEKLSYSQGLHRGFRVWIWGMGLGLPLISFIANVVAYNKLTGNGITSWDLAGGFVVTHSELNVWHKILAIAYLLGFITIAVLGAIYDK